MNLTIPTLVCAIVLASCAKPHVLPDQPELPPAFTVRAGALRDFADYRSVCVDAWDQETGTDLTPLAASVLARELPGFVNSCGACDDVLRVTFQTGHSVYTHSVARGPRFGFGHVGRTGVRGEWVAEADVWDHTGGNREECITKVAILFATFLKAAHAAALPPNKPLQPASGGWFRLLRMTVSAARG